MVQIRVTHYNWEEMVLDGYREKKETRIEYREVNLSGDPISEWIEAESKHISHAPD